MKESYCKAINIAILELLLILTCSMGSLTWGAFQYLVVGAALSFKVSSGGGNTAGCLVGASLALESMYFTQSSSFICFGFVSIRHVGR